jgi:3-hydroxymyristoyl/3-hydroxydecanoyl-(acyl carrier protein) dehydratase
VQNISEIIVTKSIRHTLELDKLNKVFLGHFPGNYIFPGVFHIKQVLDLLPPNLVGRKYIIKSSRFIKKVYPDSTIYYFINIDDTKDTDSTCLFATIKDSKDDVVAKINIEIN